MSGLLRVPVCGECVRTMVANVRFKVVRENVHVQLYFKRPLFNWNEVHTRFFEMIYDLLGQRLNVQPSEFSTNPTNTLGEARAKYNVYGGGSSVSLLADRIAFEFPSLAPTELPIVHEIMGKVHDGFRDHFSEIEQGRVEVQDYAHLDIGSQEAVNTFLNRFQVQGVAEAFGSGVINVPSAKFTVISEDGSWQSAITVERSQMQTSALFGATQLSLHKFTPTQSYLEKAGVVFDITKRCLLAVGLENEDAAT
jgi:hypothetical protein